MSFEDRHPATQHFMRMLGSYDHLPPHLREISKQCYDTAVDVLNKVPDSPELGAGLGKLVEAKDCFVRARVLADDDLRDE